MHIASNTNHLRKKAGYTQTKLAELINKTPTTISDYEKGKVLPPVDIVLKLCEIFQVNVDDFINRDIELEGITDKQAELEVLKKQHNTTDTKLLLKLMKEKVVELSKTIKEQMPEKYDELDLDDLVDLMGED
jgi:DNA-binding XRE family transcriptional regulator